MRRAPWAGGSSPLARIAFVALLVGASGCDLGSHPDAEGSEPLAFLHEETRAETGRIPQSPGATLIPPGLAEVESVPVRLAGHDFRVATRAGALVPKLVQAPCSECHDASGAAAGPLGAAGVPRRAHWQVVRAHGKAPLACGSCHTPRDPAALAVPAVATPSDTSAGPDGDGEVWPLEHSYRVCGTCHFGELRDWAGGAHGKRLVGWSGPRIVAPCTACHDPHEPGLPQRLPATSSPPPGSER